MKSVLMYSTPSCPYCIKAKKLLNFKNIAFEDINVEDNPKLRAIMQERSGRKSVPQIFIADQAIGGCDDLYALDEAGQLDKLLNEEEK